MGAAKALASLCIWQIVFVSFMGNVVLSCMFLVALYFVVTRFERADLLAVVFEHCVLSL